MKSMTAFAQAHVERGPLTVLVEIRSYNSKALDLALYLPKSCARFEDAVRKLVGERVSRGRVELRFSVENNAEDSVRYEVDEKRARAFHSALTRLKEALGLESDIALEHVIAQRDMILPLEDDGADQDLGPVILDASAEALSGLDRMRTLEGENLKEDLAARLRMLEQGLDRIRELAGTIPALYRAKLMERIASLTQGVDGLDPVRLSQEAALLADRSDISEEIVRAGSHVKQFREILQAGEPAGRKLTFMVQEFNREFNTMGSKSGSAELSYVVVDMKSELEKIREQVQNIE
jgi:uncharacterized protein (TIGR00255 family)